MLLWVGAVTKLGCIPEAWDPRFRVEKPWTINQLLEEEELCCWMYTPARMSVSVTRSNTLHRCWAWSLVCMSESLADDEAEKNTLNTATVLRGCDKVAWNALTLEMSESLNDSVCERSQASRCVATVSTHPCAATCHWLRTFAADQWSWSRDSLSMDDITGL